MDGVHASFVSSRGEISLNSRYILSNILQAIEYARSKFNLLQPGEDLTQEECLAQADALRELTMCLKPSELVPTILSVTLK